MNGGASLRHLRAQLRGLVATGRLSAVRASYFETEIDRLTEQRRRRSAKAKKANGVWAKRIAALEFEAARRRSGKRGSTMLIHQALSALASRQEGREPNR